MSGVADLVGQLVETAAALMQLTFEPSPDDRYRLRALAETVANIAADLGNRRIPSAIHFAPAEEHSSDVPFLYEMEATVSLIPQAFAGSQSMHEYLPLSEDVPRSKLSLQPRS